MVPSTFLPFTFLIVDLILWPTMHAPCSSASIAASVISSYEGHGFAPLCTMIKSFGAGSGLSRDASPSSRDSCLVLPPMTIFFTFVNLNRSRSFSISFLFFLFTTRTTSLTRWWSLMAAIE
jgi:hypothetical protein